MEIAYHLLQPWKGVPWLGAMEGGPMARSHGRGYSGIKIFKILHIIPIELKNRKKDLFKNTVVQGYESYEVKEAKGLEPKKSNTKYSFLTHKKLVSLEELT